MSSRGAGVIRPGTLADVALLGPIELAAGKMFPPARIPDPDHTFPVAALERAVAAGLLFVLESDAEVVGFATCSRTGQRLHLDELSVHPDHGRQGHGRALVQRVILAADELNLEGVSLTTFADIVWNGPFYASLGFVEVPETGLDAPLRAALAEERALGMTERVAMIRFCDAERGGAGG